jgi:hypothetical protein
MKHLIALITLLLALVACRAEPAAAPALPSPTGDAPAAPPASVDPTATRPPAAAPGNAEPTVSPADPGLPPTEAPTATASTAPAEAPAVNGRYEQTYFRGAQDAPVTIIDYSDFL